MNPLQPHHAITLPGERRAELTRLLAQFAPDASATASRYADLRERAAQHVAQIEALLAHGEPIDDAVLRGLLPHADTQQNRWRGAWVHVAPTINADIRRWYEAAGWVQPRDWDAVAVAIWRFVQRCVDDPAHLAEACRDFSALPYAKGFQSGTLSPILNALRPDDFLLLHSQSLRALNYFADGKFSSALATYPAANVALQALVVQSAELAGWGDGARPADLFDAFCLWLLEVQKFPFRPTRQWLVAIDDATQWAAWQAGQYVALAGGELGDLSGIPRREFERRRDSLLAQPASQLTKRAADLAWRFARQVREGDGMLARKANVVVGQGVVAGPYFYVDEEGESVTRGHRVPVAWADVPLRRVGGLPRGDFAELERGRVELLADAPVVEEGEIGDWVVEGIAHADSPTASASNGVRLAESNVSYLVSSRPSNPPYPLADLARDTHLDEATLARYVRAIERKGQAIFYGPPGTGKTFVAEKLVRYLVAESDDNAGDGFAELVQFHPAYSYEDFVQGLRPNTSADELGGTLRYDIVPGRFLDFCRRAAACTGRCVLIVDEINRANLSRVFGELMYLLEYRDRAVTLAGSDAPFAIPANVRLLGTMNTADRSIALVDHALRRRFAFIELLPNWEVLRRFHDAPDFDVEPLIEVLRHINRAIDDPHYALGHSFFLDEALAGENLATTLRDVWEMEIEPYLSEYFFDQPERVDEFRWARVEGELGVV